ncbi:hypothetical protein EJ03DRAFT_265559 [Teratosphaeria nubilosa]|uniref:Initiation-specific alpha-1,6-mannosyltransferase n=1 Tax=Teratosphaeria nubilosa TaxID=161662 RepID=A0A6G1LJE3_9PEZI|nr:hypothetical protein EJ03DRAFT_265559 [Teratosphaeria nubilosa]
MPNLTRRLSGASASYRIFTRRRTIALARLVLILSLLVWFLSPGNLPWGSNKKRPLRERLACNFPYNSTADLPRRIWQTWKNSPLEADFPGQYRNSVISWTALNPDFEHLVVTDDDAASLIGYLYASVPEVTDAYKALLEPILKADFFRYLVLLAQGGIYSDIDTHALKPVVHWVPATMESWGLVIGIEADPDRPDWRDWYARRIQFCQWTIGSKPGHPVLVDIVASIAEKTLEQNPQGESISELNVMEFTGPGAWTDALFHFFETNEPVTEMQAASWERFTNLTQPIQHVDVVVLPITSFSPGVGHMGAKEANDPLAFVQHGFSGKHNGSIDEAS